MEVGIVGAGIGGLALAQALSGSGDEVHVWDRDERVDHTGGYRLHLDARARGTLSRWLDAELQARIVAESAPPESFRQLAVSDHRLRVLVRSRRGEDEGLLIGRIPLRALLCEGLADRVHFGRRFEAYEVRTDGRVDARFADGSSATVDLLVGADGVGSRVAAALAHHPTSQRLGLGGVAGRTAIGPGNHDQVPPLLAAGPALAVGPGGIGMFLTLDREDLIWSVLAVDPRFPSDMRRRPTGELPRIAGGLLGGWDEGVRQLVRQSREDSAAYFAFSAADPGADLAPWEPGPVTALGDAVHAMPPTGGQAAATAVRDAGVLAGTLERFRRGEVDLAGAVGAYEREMATYASSAVAESLVPVRWIRASSGRVATVVARGLLPLAAAAATTFRKAS